MWRQRAGRGNSGTANEDVRRMANDQQRYEEEGKRSIG